MFPVTISASSSKHDSEKQKKPSRAAAARRAMLIRMGMAAGGVILVVLIILGVVFATRSSEPQAPENNPFYQHGGNIAEPTGIIEALTTNPMRGITLLFTKHTIPTVISLVFFVALVAGAIALAVILPEYSGLAGTGGSGKDKPADNLTGMAWLSNQIKTSGVAQGLVALVSIVILVLIIGLGILIKSRLSPTPTVVVTPKPPVVPPTTVITSIAKPVMDKDIEALYTEIKALAPARASKLPATWAERFLNSNRTIIFIQTGYPELRFRCNNAWPLPNYYMIYLVLQNTIEKDDVNPEASYQITHEPHIFIAMDDDMKPLDIRVLIKMHTVYAFPLTISKDHPHYDDVVGQLKIMKNFFEDGEDLKYFEGK